jgi:hypothetical protein
VETSWRHWWVINRYRFLPLRAEPWAARVVTPAPRPDVPTAAELRRDELLREALPFLLRLVETHRGSRDDVVASSLIALAKLSNDGVTRRIILRELKDPQASVMVRSSAALAVGLLRRTDPDRQIDACAVDALRDGLLAVAAQREAAIDVRAFAILAVGLLADQPFDGPYARNGLLVSRALWQLLAKRYPDEEIPVALLTALGMQPAAGVPSAVMESLVAIVEGRIVLKRRWSDMERSHALSALLRLGGTRAFSTLLSVFGRTRVPDEIQRAGYLAVGHLADELSAPQRLALTRTVLAAGKRTQKDFTRGLALVALGHLLSADLRGGESAVLRQTTAGRLLLEEARGGKNSVRGFAVLALGVAARTPGAPDEIVAPFLRPVRRFLLRELADARRRHPLRGSYAAALGIANVTESAPRLGEIVADEESRAWVRGVAALALGHLETIGEDDVDRLRAATSLDGVPFLPGHAATALWTTGERLADTALMDALRRTRAEHRRAELVVAMGRLGDVEGVGPLVAWTAAEGRSEVGQALGVVAIGMLLDPEPRPSITRLTDDGNYPVRSRALNEAWSIY